MDLSERGFTKKLLKKNLIKIRWKISSPCTNNRNIHFCTLRSLDWKYVGLQCHPYPVSMIIMFKIQKDPATATDLSYHKETIVSTGGRRQYHNIIRPQYFCDRIRRQESRPKVILCKVPEVNKSMWYTDVSTFLYPHQDYPFLNSTCLDW
jgi:hypothetical protein